MSTTRVQATTFQGTTPITFTLSSAPTAGNLLVAWIATGAGNVHAFTGANGFALLSLGTQGNPSGQLAWKVADAGDAGSTSVAVATFNQPSVCDGVLVEWATTSGWPASPVDIESAHSVASTAAYTTPTATPTSGLADAVVATGYFTIANRTFSAEAVTGSNVGTIVEDGQTSHAAALATGVISSTSGSYQGTATLSGPGGAGFAAIAIFKPVPPITTAYKDVTSRVRLQIRNVRDVTIRFALRSAQLKDATLRLRLRATTYRDATARVRLYVLRYAEATARINIALALGQAYRDVSARVAVRATAWRDATLRTIIAIPRSIDCSLRFRCRAARTRDATFRLVLAPGMATGQQIVVFSTAYNASGDQGLLETRTIVVGRTEYGPKDVA